MQDKCDGDSMARACAKQPNVDSLFFFFQALKSLCLDSKRSKVLQRLELSLDILGGTVERISNTAEVLGAVHQVLPR